MSAVYYQPVLDTRDGQSVVAFKIAAGGTGMNCAIPFDVLRQWAEKIDFPLECLDSHLTFARQCQPYLVEVALARQDSENEVVLTFADLNL